MSLVFVGRTSDGPRECLRDLGDVCRGVELGFGKVWGAGILEDLAVENMRQVEQIPTITMPTHSNREHVYLDNKLSGVARVLVRSCSRVLGQVPWARYLDKLSRTSSLDKLSRTSSLDKLSAHGIWTSYLGQVPLSSYLGQVLLTSYLRMVSGQIISDKFS